MMAFARTLSGVELVLDKAEVCRQFELPIDREGDFAVFSDRNTVVGARREDHNLSQLAGTSPSLARRPRRAEGSLPGVAADQCGVPEAGKSRAAPQLRHIRFRAYGVQ